MCLYSPKATSSLNLGDGPDAKYNIPLIAVSLMFLLHGYSSRVIGIFGPTSTLARKRLRSKPGSRYNTVYIEVATKAGFPWLVLKGRLAIFYVLLEATYEIYESMLWELGSKVRLPSLVSSSAKVLHLQIISLTSAMIWGTLRLVATRTESVVAGEGVWGFGQILPMLLSTLLLWAIDGTIYGESLQSWSLMSFEVTLISQLSGLSRRSTIITSIQREHHTHRGLQGALPNVLVLQADHAYVWLRVGHHHWLSCEFHSTFFLDLTWGTDGMTDPVLLPTMVAEYLILLSFCIVILLIFTAVCLGFATGNLPVPGLIVRWQTKLESQGHRKHGFVRECLWAPLLILLVVVVWLFDRQNFLIKCMVVCR